MLPFRGNGIHHLASKTTPWRHCGPADHISIAQHFRALRPLSATYATQRQEQRDQDIKSKGRSDASAQSGRPRKVSPKTSSLRGPAVAAAAARTGLISRRGNRTFVDSGVETKDILAYCSAEKYSLSVVVRSLQRHGYKLDPYLTGLHKEVVHFRTTYFVSDIPQEDSKELTDIGDVFIFPSGTMVTWNIPDNEGRRILNNVIASAAEGADRVVLETEEFRYVEDPSRDNSRVIGDTIILGTKDGESPSERSASAVGETDMGGLGNETDLTLAKIAFSSGLARSTKLAALEIRLDAAFDDTRPIIQKLSKGSRLPFTRRYIIRKIGDILDLRAQLNLYTDLTDPLPDYFWDSKHELGLEGYYDAIGHALDINDRIELLNKKINYTQEIASVLREQLSENHGTRLEWIIIGLITIEVFFELYRQYREHQESVDENSTQNLLRRFLENQDPNRPD